MGLPARATNQPRSQIDMLAADVGQRIRAARQQRGLSLAAVGGDDLSRSFLSLVELGRSRISLRALSIVAERLDLPISYFLADTAQTGASELALDTAEAALAQQRAETCLALLDKLPEAARLDSRALLLRGRALVDLGRATEAIPVLYDTLSRSRDQQLGREPARVLYYLGAALYAAGVYAEALSYFRQALETAVGPNDDPVLAGKITVYLGHILFIQDDIDGALSHYARARDLFGSFGDLNALACTYSGLSAAYDRKGDVANALRYSKLSLGAFEAQNDALQAARELNNMAMKFRELDEIAPALESAREAVTRASLLHAPEIEALAHSTLASIHLQAGELDDAQMEAEATEAFPEAGRTLALIGSWIVQAEVAERKGDSDRADRLFGHALEVLKLSNWAFAYPEKALAYSLMLRRRGDTDRALHYALEAAQAKSA